MGVGDTMILDLVDEAIETGRSPEEVCASCPELLPEVRRRIAAYQLLESRLNDYFPGSQGSGNDPELTAGRAPPTLPGYEIVSTLGRGGMGVVFLARHEKLRRHVAVKMLQAGPYASAVERERFQREARSLAALRHPNIVSIHDVGESEGYPYFTMEYMSGGTLADKSRAEPKPHGEAARIVRTLADAVDHAHRCGIIHRDLKPANILLDTDGTLKISDFGIARSPHTDRAITIDGARMGTPSYMAPEQVGGRADETGPATDVYALGAILYEMLTGRPPFVGESHAETDRQVIADDPVPPSRLNPKTPRDIETVCLACLQKSPGRRHATAAALRDDLDRCLAGRPILARPVGTAERAVKWARRHPAHTTIACTLAFGLVAMVAMLVWVQRVEGDRRAETLAREERARQTIETAITQAVNLRSQRRWREAGRAVEDARTRLPEAGSTEFESRLARVADDLALAQELDEIRRGFPMPGEQGYDYGPGLVSYQGVFERIGLGPGVPPEEAARRVRGSAIRDEFIVGFDNAAFAAHVHQQTEMERLLLISRSASPDPWGDRFRLPETWRSAEKLIELGKEARAASPAPPTHQMVILGVLLWELGETEHAIDVLRDMQRRSPDDFWINLELGNALRLSGRDEEACQYYRAAVVIQPENFAAWTTLGVMLRRVGLTEEASIACRRAVELNPRFILAWTHLIYQLAALERFEESREAYARAIELNPGHADDFSTVRGSTELLRARSCASRCEWAEAATSYQISLESRRWEASDPWFEYAATSLLAGSPQAYERVRRRILEQAQSGNLRSYIAARACTLAPTTDDLFVEISGLSEEELSAWGTRHWSLAEQGALLVRGRRAKDAPALLEQSLAADPRPGAAVVGWAWLALAHAELGHADESASWRTKARAWLDSHGGRMPEDADKLALHLHNWLEAWVLLREADQHGQ